MVNGFPDQQKSWLIPLNLKLPYFIGNICFVISQPLTPEQVQEEKTVTTGKRTSKRKTRGAAKVPQEETTKVPQEETLEERLAPPQESTTNTAEAVGFESGTSLRYADAAAGLELETGRGELRDESAEPSRDQTS